MTEGIMVERVKEWRNTCGDSGGEGEREAEWRRG